MTPTDSSGTDSSPRGWSSAFEWAASARAAAGTIVEQVRSGEVTLLEAFEIGDNHALVGRVFAVKVFEAVPDIGKVRSRRTMAAIGLADDITLAAVPPEARSKIADEFGKLT